jgi:hypothetical protein
MPVSERRLAANRANARRSTGPRTRGGKAAAARNALVHGLTARSPLLPGEDPKVYRRFGQRLFDELRPRGAMQEELAAEVVNLSWKLRRVPGAESLLLTEEHGREGPYGGHGDGRVEVPPLRVLCNMVLSKRAYDHSPASPVWLLDRYALRIERSRAAALRMLLALQKRERQRDEAGEADDEGGIDRGGTSAARAHAPVQNEPTAAGPTDATQDVGPARDASVQRPVEDAQAGPAEATAAVTGGGS